MSLEFYEPSDTQMFTFISSVAPDSAPIFKVQGIAGTIIASITALTSDSTHYMLYLQCLQVRGFI